MRAGFAIAAFSAVAFAQPAAFEVATVKTSPRSLGPDYNNRLTISPSRLAGSNVTLRRLIAEAHGIQMSQVVGANWLDENEYEIDARAGSEVGRDRMRSMLLTLLTQRFDLRLHREQRAMRAYELTVDKGGAKISPSNGVAPAAARGGFPFHGTMRQLADLIAVQLTISVPTDPTTPGIGAGPPAIVLDKTGLEDLYDLSIDIRPEPGTEIFTLWQRFAQDRLGLKLQSTRSQVPVIVVDSAERTPEGN
jgi:uncharacterized protein (TIGR03435 family)